MEGYLAAAEGGGDLGVLGVRGIVWVGEGGEGGGEKVGLGDG